MFPECKAMRTWQEPRRNQAMELFQKTLEYYSMLQRNGIIESFEPSIIAAYGGGLGGFIIIRGDVENWRKSDDKTHG